MVGGRLPGCVSITSVLPTSFPDKHVPHIISLEIVLTFTYEMCHRFLADCLCHDPLLGDSPTKYSTNLPSDVDEELFQPDSAGLPPPNIESLHGNIEYFIQRNRSVPTIAILPNGYI